MANKKRRRGASARDIGILVLCVVLPVVGLPLLWLVSRWKAVVKAPMTLVATASLALMVTLIPMNDNRPVGGVTFVGAKPRVEIYGPEMPETMVTGYTAPLEASEREVLASTTETPETYVYATESEGIYHTANCVRRYATSIQMTPYEAYYYGYQPCPKCNPATYEPPARTAQTGEGAEETEISEDTENTENTENTEIIEETEDEPEAIGESPAT